MRVNPLLRSAPTGPAADGTSHRAPACRPGPGNVMTTKLTINFFLIMKQGLLKLAATAVMLFLAVSFAGSEAAAQTRTLTGTVVDHEGSPVVGAAVIVDGTTRGTSTGSDGKFALNGVSPAQHVTVSYIGYMSRTVAVGNVTDLKIILDEDAQSLESVVVIGYGVQKKSDVTGAITSIKGDGLASRSVENVQQALQGKAAGVQIFSASAAPGSSPSVRIRGFSSQNTGAAEPLYVVDGLKVSDISYLDPSFIESMEILKDGASAAIYGVEAGNGVVLITTKKGAKGGRVFYDFTYGITSLATKPDLMNAKQFIAYQKAAGNETLMSNWDGKTDTDWLDALYGDGGSIQRHTVGFETANDKGSFYGALSYMDNEGMYYGNKDYMNRLTFQVNGSYQIKPWLQFTTNNSIETMRYERPGDGIGTQCWNSPYFYDPLTPLFYDKDNLPDYMKALIKANGDEAFMKNEHGDYAAVPQYTSDSTNPMTYYYSQNSEHKDFNVRGSAALDFKPLKGLVFTSRVGYRLESANYTYDGKPVYFSISPRTKLNYSSQTSSGTFYNWENFANYTNTFGKHGINAMVGMSYQYSWSNYTKGSTDTFTNPADNFHYLHYSSADANDSVDGEKSESSSISYFGRLSYSYDERYNLQVSFRADAYDSSKLSRDARWGYFPSVSAGWTVSNEKFLRDVDPQALSYLKVRGSWGINGNIKTLSGYPYASAMNSTDYYPIGGSLTTTLTPSDVLANAELNWEESHQWDLGLDARFLNNRLRFTMDFYNKDTKGLLVSMTSPLSSGTSTVTRNVGKVNNHGFEFELGWQDRVGDFSYGVSANLATLSNEVKSLEGVTRIEDTLSNGMVFFEEGYPVWSYYGWDYQGVDKATGEAIYRNVDGNDVINDKDKVHLGTAIPDFTYGLTINAAWKGLDFTLLGSGSHGGKLCLSSRSRPYANRPAEWWTESWNVVGAGAEYPHPDVNGDAHMLKSSMQLYSGSYFKIKQLQLGYTIPASLTRKIAISKLRVFISLDNFFCITSYPGMDPESVSATSAIGMDYGDYPSPKTLTFGANLSF